MWKWFILSVLSAVGAVGAFIDKPQSEFGFRGMATGLALAALFFWLGWRKYKKNRKPGKAKPQKVKTALLANEFSAMVPNTLFSKSAQSAWDEAQEYAARKGMSPEKFKQQIIATMPFIIQAALADAILTVEEEKSIHEFTLLAGLTSDDIPQQSAELFVKAAVLRDLTEGKVVPRMHATKSPFNLQKQETLIWAFPNVSVYTSKIHTEFQAGTSGMGVRVAKGVYLRTGDIKGRRVKKEVLQHLGSGPVVIASHNLYYLTGSTSGKIPVSKIISVAATDESVIVYRTGEKNMPLEFMVDDPWFFGNALLNAGNWQK